MWSGNARKLPLLMKWLEFPW